MDLNAVARAWSRGLLVDDRGKSLQRDKALGELLPAKGDGADAKRRNLMHSAVKPFLDDNLRRLGRRRDDAQGGHIFLLGCLLLLNPLP